MVSSSASRVRRTDGPPTRGSPKAGWAKVVDTAPGHVETVRENVIDALTPKQVAQLAEIAGAVLERIDPDGVMSPR